jgi:hypothetical protein
LQVRTDQTTCAAFFPHPPPTASSERRIPDVTFVSSSAGVPEALDVTVRRVEPQSGVPGSSAAAAEQRKLREYGPWLAQRGSGRFTPLALEPLGCLGAAFVQFLRRCGRHHATRLAGFDVQDAPDGAATQFFRQRVAVALQRAQSQVFRGFLDTRGRGDAAFQADLEAFEFQEAQAWQFPPPTRSEAALLEADE